MNREPTVLDFVKSLLRGKPLAIPQAQAHLKVPNPLQTRLKTSL